MAELAIELERKLKENKAKKNGIETYLTARYVQTGFGVTEVTDRWHFLHALYLASMWKHL